jgi:NitT/TauT family transport system substrate-binding protein
MHMMRDRRRFLATLSSAGAAGLIGAPASRAQDGRLETTTVRLAQIPGICVAPQYVAKELLKSEGFADVQYVELGTANVYPASRAYSQIHTYSSSSTDHCQHEPTP